MASQAELDSKMMIRAINQARQCPSTDHEKPKVGAVIAIGKAVLAEGYRNENNHAEQNAIENVRDRTQLAQATLYTTLEPCTPEVRSVPSTCCTALIQQHHFKRVLIGILDPNQGVRGKGLWELQSHGIEVELFPPALATEIINLNVDFIRFQQSLGLRITNVKDGQKIRTWDKGGAFDLKGTYTNPPGEDTFALACYKDRWSFQADSVKVTNPNKKLWAVRFNFGEYDLHTLYIVKAGELGIALRNYYRRVVEDNKERTKLLKDKFKSSFNGDLRKTLPGDFPVIKMGKLPKGLEMQARVDVIVEQREK